jgi:hypothetical protein
MKLDRNVNGNSSGKYGLIKNRRLAQIRAWGTDDHDRAIRLAVENALALLEQAGIINWGETQETEFFVIKLKDCYAEHALTAYALAARRDDPEYARDVANLAQRSGRRHPHCKRPD